MPDNGVHHLPSVSGGYPYAISENQLLCAADSHRVPVTMPRMTMTRTATVVKGTLRTVHPMAPSTLETADGAGGSAGVCESAAGGGTTVAAAAVAECWVCA